jgi:D-sedoheptulose 7-phosphate isomerase
MMRTVCPSTVHGCDAEWNLRSGIIEIFEESARVRDNFLKANLEILEEAIQSLASTIEQGKKIMFFGNGGSAADAQHLAAEFVNRYMMDRPPLPALALTTDSSILTAIANDFSFEEIFSKQIRALGQPGDAAVGISTSGSSPNVLRGLETAHDMGLTTVGIGGSFQAPMREACRYYLSLQDAPTPRIQETHLIIGHTMVELIDRILFGRGSTT